MKVEEESLSNEPIDTELAEHVDGIVNQTLDNPYLPAPIPIGDAAILMAADGYGSGHIKGKIGDESVLIRTSDTIRNFQFERDPDPHELYKKAKKILQDITDERHMEH